MKKFSSGYIPARADAVRCAAMGRTSAPIMHFPIMASCSFDMGLRELISYRSAMTLYAESSSIPVPHAKSAILNCVMASLPFQTASSVGGSVMLDRSIAHSGRV